VNTTFRSALQTDVPCLLRMMKEFYAIDQYPFDATLAQTNLLELIRNEALGKIWLIEPDESPIGYFVLTYGFSFEFKGRIALLDEFYISADHRDAGAGKKALEFLLEIAPTLQLKTLLMEVEKHNERAIHLYKKMGFRDHNRLILSRVI
jgi:ribosomal protein S18 acetylase RimI-like enzyme